MNILLSQLCHWLDLPKPATEIECHSISIDSRRMEPSALFIAIQGENFDGHQFLEAAKEKGALAAIVSAPLQTTLPTLLVNDTRQALGKIAKKWREQRSLPVIAVTGSCGKTGTKSMIAQILECAGDTIATEGTLNNDIGLPLTILKLAKHDYAVFELGANHLGEIAYLADIAQPTVSVITNVAAAHLEGFISLEGVAQEKSAIYQALSPSGIAILNNDDQYSDFFREVIGKRKIVTFSTKQKADFYASDIQLDAEMRPRFILETPEGRCPIHLSLIGTHQVPNALAAAAACFSAGISLENIQKGLTHATPIYKRLVIKKGKQGTTIIDDSYNANPLSVSAALEVLAHYPHETLAVLGDMGELGSATEESHRDIGKKAKQLGIHALYTIGKFGHYTAEAFGKGGQHFENKPMLIAAIQSVLKNNMAILVKGSRSAKMEEVVDSLTMEN
jgi:UDP-N-acetylmuramoyl-tripeptide--D-alanyl-D-alanine ligase